MTSSSLVTWTRCQVQRPAQMSSSTGWPSAGLTPSAVRIGRRGARGALDNGRRRRLLRLLRCGGTRQSRADCAHGAVLTRRGALLDEALRKAEARVSAVGQSIAARHPDRYDGSAWPGIGAEGRVFTLSAAFGGAVAALARARAWLDGGECEGRGEAAARAAAREAARVAARPTRCALCLPPTPPPPPPPRHHPRHQHHDRRGRAHETPSAQQPRPGRGGRHRRRRRRCRGSPHRTRDESDRTAECLSNAAMIFCTLSVAGSHVVRNMPPVRYLIVDEAAQATELKSLIPLSLLPSAACCSRATPTRPSCMCTSAAARRAGLPSVR